MKIGILLFFIISLTSCSEYKKNELNWALDIANSIMARNDSLVNFMDKKESWQYDYALLAGAIGKLSDCIGDQKYYNYMKDYVDYYVREDGSIRYCKLDEYNLDKIRPGINLFLLYEKTGEEKYKIAIETEIEQLKTHPRTTDGGFWHKKIYPWQMWLDGIYMACPFMAEYASDFNEPEWFDEVGKQINLIYKNTLDNNTGLLYHGWDESLQQKWADPVTGKSKHFWSRSMGWYMMALVDVLDYMPKEHPDCNKIIEILNNVSHAILKVQDEDTGLWYQVLDRGGEEGNYLETSGSCMFIYAFAKGTRKGYLPEFYLKAATKAFSGIRKNLIIRNEDGYFDLIQICGGCGLGGKPYRDGSYDYYVNETIVVNDPKGLAPFILAGMELDKSLKEN